jgi:hypothetical protein
MQIEVAVEEVAAFFPKKTFIVKKKTFIVIVR